MSRIRLLLCLAAFSSAVVLLVASGLQAPVSTVGEWMFPLLPTAENQNPEIIYAAHAGTGLHAALVNPGQIRLTVSGLTALEQTLLWLLAVLATPWLLQSLIRNIFQRRTLALPIASVAVWMIVVPVSGWCVWGQLEPQVFVLMTMPLLCVSTIYFIFVCDQIDPTTTGNCLSRTLA